MATHLVVVIPGKMCPSFANSATITAKPLLKKRNIEILLRRSIPRNWFLSTNDLESVFPSALIMANEARPGNFSIYYLRSSGDPLDVECHLLLLLCSFGEEDVLFCFLAAKVAPFVQFRYKI